MSTKFPATLFLFLCLFSLVAAARADDHAVILIYHHVAGDTPASTSVTPEAFAQHLDYLEQNDFNVLPLTDVISALDRKEPLPGNAVAITFDDAYRSVYSTARPMLQIRDMPFTVFVSTDYIDQNLDNYMTWVELRELAEQGATIGNHGTDHVSALSKRRGESRDEWLERFRVNVLTAQERISVETSSVPAVYAWPYGEFNADVEQVISKLGWYAVGQQSGAAGYDASMTAVPRFPIATGYDDMDAFRLRMHSEPLPLQIESAPERWLANGSPAPELTFSLSGDDYAVDGVNCFNARGERLTMSRKGENVLAVRSPSALSAGRSKYTCTAPSRSKEGVFGWYSHLWVVQSP